MTREQPSFHQTGPTSQTLQASPPTPEPLFGNTNVDNESKIPPFTSNLAKIQLHDMKNSSFFFAALLAITASASPTPKAPKHQKVDVDEMSGHFQCVSRCIRDLSDHYDVASKTREQFCNWDRPQAHMFLHTKVSKCIGNGCSAEDQAKFQPSKKLHFDDSSSIKVANMRQ